MMGRVSTTWIYSESGLVGAWYEACIEERLWEVNRNAKIRLNRESADKM